MAVVRILSHLLGAVLLLLAVAWGAARWREDDSSAPPGVALVATPLGRVAVAGSGRPTGRAVLIVPGTAGWSGFWRDAAARLARRGYRVIAADLPPFGYSDRDPLARYDRTSQARRLAAVIAARAGGPVTVVGHSFGAGAATELALRYPERVRRLVLVDPALGELDPDGKGESGLLKQPIIAQPMVAASLTNPLATEALLRSMLARKEEAAAWVDTIRRPMRRTGTTAAYAAWAPALFAADDGGWSRRSARLRAMRPPVALIWGEADTVTPIAQGERLARLLRPRRFIRLAGVGHIPHIEDPARFGAALETAMEGER